MLALCCGPACAEPARDITSACKFNAASGRKTFAKCHDGRYTTYWQTANGDKAYVEVTVPGGQTASGVMVRFYEHTHAWGVQIQDGSGAWVDAGHTDGSYLTEYLPLPEGTVSFRIANAPGNKTRYRIADLRIYGPGEIPPEVQQWQPPLDKADLMLLVAHADDEVLWFGGALPTYAGERGRACQVCMLVPSMPYRRLELLDSLWTCGVRNYPAWARFPDSFSASLSRQYKHWSKNKVYEVVTEWIRRFQPEVLLTQDVGGEYGHGAHRVCADAAMHCIGLAADAKKYPGSVKAYGTWDVPKCYIHLYPENVVDMDWRQPLASFGGRTSFEVAEDAFRCHVSQQKTDYHVEDWGSCDNSLFGLYRSLVGPDEEKNDFFEHLN